MTYEEHRDFLVMQADESEKNLDLWAAELAGFDLGFQSTITFPPVCYTDRFEQLRFACGFDDGRALALQEQVKDQQPAA